MKTIQVIYENGVFRPTEPVNLPEGAPVTVTLSADTVDSARSSEPDEDGLDELYAILSRTHRTGVTDLAARHNEHQP